MDDRDPAKFKGLFDMNPDTFRLCLLGWPDEIVNTHQKSIILRSMIEQCIIAAGGRQGLGDDLDEILRQKTLFRINKEPTPGDDGLGYSGVSLSFEKTADEQHRRAMGQELFCYAGEFYGCCHGVRLVMEVVD